MRAKFGVETRTFAPVGVDDTVRMNAAASMFS